MQNPLQKLSKKLHHALFWTVLASTFAMIVLMSGIQNELKSCDESGENCKPQIVALEFAGSIECAEKIIKKWGGPETAKKLQRWDYFFLLVYSFAFFLGITLLNKSESLKTKWPLKLGIFLAWGSLLAGACDLFENLALHQVLHGSENELFPKSAAIFAGIKFALLLFAFLYVLAGLFAHLFRSLKNKPVQ